MTNPNPNETDISVAELHKLMIAADGARTAAGHAIHQSESAYELADRAYKKLREISDRLVAAREASSTETN